MYQPHHGTVCNGEGLNLLQTHDIVVSERFTLLPMGARLHATSQMICTHVVCAYVVCAWVLYACAMVLIDTSVNATRMIIMSCACRGRSVVRRVLRLVLAYIYRGRRATVRLRQNMVMLIVTFCAKYMGQCLVEAVVFMMLSCTQQSSNHRADATRMVLVMCMQAQHQRFVLVSRAAYGIILQYRVSLHDRSHTVRQRSTVHISFNTMIVFVMGISCLCNRSLHTGIAMGQTDYHSKM